MEFNGPGDGQFYAPRGIATGQAGNVYVVDGVQNRVKEFTGTGTFVGDVGEPGSFNNPFFVESSVTGDVYVSDNDYNWIQRFRISPPPTLGETLGVALVSGTVQIKPRGQRQFEPLTTDTTIPVRSTVDTTEGKVRLTAAANRSGSKTEQADSSDGVFKATQSKRGDHTTRLTLEGPDPVGCGSAMKPGRRGNGLFGSGRGHFQTVGNHGSAATNGKTAATWPTEERCEGTYFAVKSGTVKVRDFTRDRTIVCAPGITIVSGAAVRARRLRRRRLLALACVGVGAAALGILALAVKATNSSSSCQASMRAFRFAAAASARRHRCRLRRPDDAQRARAPLAVPTSAARPPDRSSSRRRYPDDRVRRGILKSDQP